MPRFKPYSYEQAKLIPVDFTRQLQPGTLKFALSHIVDRMDLSIFHDRFHDDGNILKTFRYSPRFAYG